MSGKAIAKGITTFILPRSLYSRSTGGTDSARYCYSVFLRHLVRMHAAGASIPFGTIAELGPGDSIGVGLAALIAAGQRYVAFEVRPFADRERNLRIFDELAAMFHARAAIPDLREIPEIGPPVSTTAFPDHILSDKHLAAALNPDRLGALRDCLDREAFDPDGAVAFVAPWFDASLVRAAASIGCSPRPSWSTWTTSGSRTNAVSGCWRLVQ